jgi:hypothetical protein
MCWNLMFSRAVLEAKCPVLRPQTPFETLQRLVGNWRYRHEANKDGNLAEMGCEIRGRAITKGPCAATENNSGTVVDLIPNI